MEITSNLAFQQQMPSDYNTHIEADDSDLEEDDVGAPKPEVAPQCGCLEGDTSHNENVEGPYYSQLGVGPSVAALRRTLELRTGHTGSAIRIEKLLWSGKEGKSKEGCPAARYILRRNSPVEQIMCLVRQRVGHDCRWSWQIIAIVYWEPIPPAFADDCYNFLRTHLPSQGIQTDRRCGTNDSRTCACQGFNEAQQGAAYSFGCSWSMYHNACKFARGSRSLNISNNNNGRSPRKFRLRGTRRGPEERELEHRINDLADRLSGICSHLAPDAFNRQVLRDSVAFDCRLGNGSGIARPFAGVTACFDYCSHNHRENHNMEGGVTAVVTLLGKNRPNVPRNLLGSGHEEQLHVLPMYHLDRTDEFGTRAGQAAKEMNNSVQHLKSFERLVRQRAFPLPSGHARRRQARAARSVPSVDSKSPVTPIPSSFIINSMTSVSNVSPGQISPTDKATKTAGHRCTIRLPSIDSWFRKPLNCLPPAGCWCKDPAVSNQHNTMRAIPISISEAIKDNELRSQLTAVADTRPVPTDREYWSQTEDLFQSSEMGGVGIALTHGSVLLEVAKREVHSTTALRQPNRLCPTRIGLLFYQHRNLHLAEHGRHDWRLRMEKKRAKKLVTTNPRKGSQKHNLHEDDEDLDEESEDSKYIKFQQSISQPLHHPTQILSNRYLVPLEQYEYESCVRE